MNRFKKALFRRKRKSENRFKYLMSVLHLWLGLLSSIIVFIVCLTGSIYTFKNQIIDVYNYDLVYVKPKKEPFISLDTIHQQFKERQLSINQITIPAQKNKSFLVSYTDIDLNSGTYYVHPFSGKILGTGDYSLVSFFEIILDIHKTLLVNEVGKQIVGASILIFVFMLFSGFVLWLPKKLSQLKNGLKIKFKARFYRLNYDLHKVLGFYSLLLLLLIAITGLYVSYPWVKSGIIVALGGEPVLNADNTVQQKEEISADFSKLLEEYTLKEEEKEILKDSKTISIDSLLIIANKKLDYKAITTITLPNQEDPWFIIKKINRENLLKALLPDVIMFNKTGELKQVDVFKNKTISDQFVEISLPLHTGEILGTPSLILYFLVSLIGCSLPITGFIIWYKKLKK